MKVPDYAQTYREMSDVELAKLLAEGRDALTDAAREALDEELAKRGLSDEALAREYPSQKPTPEPDTSPRQKWLSYEEVRSLKGLRRWKVAVITLSLVATLGFTFLRQREARMEALYGRVVMGMGSSESQSALRQLATYRGRHAQDLILQVARNRNPLDLAHNRIEAIRILGKRGDVDTAVRLAETLRPYEGLDVREAVAESLLELPCASECVRLVLDYRERMWRGDTSLESLIGSAAKEIGEQSLEIDRKLDRLLLNHKDQTLSTLIRHYGLGDIAVSPFPLYLVVHLGITDACPYLQIDKQFKPFPEEEKVDPAFAKARKQINDAKQALSCPAPGK
jgi:hypothetical protein